MIACDLYHASHTTPDPLKAIIGYIKRVIIVLSDHGSVGDEVMTI